MSAGFIRKIPEKPNEKMKRFLTATGLIANVSTLFILYAPFAALIGGRYPTYASEYALASWFVNYDAGFLSRGLAGTVAKLLFPIESYISCVGLVSNAALAASIATWILLTVLLVRKFKEDAYTAEVMLCMPWASVLIVDMMQPRTDLLMIFIYEACIAVYLTKARFRTAFATAASTVAVFIHQGFALFFTPFIFILIARRDGLRKAFLYGALLLIPFSACQFIQVPKEETILESAYEMQSESDFDERIRLPGLFAGAENRTESMIRMEYGEDKTIANFEKVGAATENFRILFRTYGFMTLIPFVFFLILSKGMWRSPLYAAAVFGCYAVVFATQTDWLRFLMMFEIGFGSLVATDLICDEDRTKIPEADSWFSAIFVAFHQLAFAMTAFIYL